MRLTHGLLDLRPLRGSAAFRRLWLGHCLSAVGGQLTVVAVLHQVWELTASPVALGLIGLAQAVPAVVLGQVGGLLADALDRRRLVLLGTLGQAAAATLLLAHAVSERGSLTAVLLLAAVVAGCGALSAPARRTFPVRLLPAARVGAGLALMHLNFQAAILAGPALAGVLIAQRGVAACYLLDALSFGAALYAVARLPALPPEGCARRSAASTAIGAAVHAVAEGWRFVLRRPVLRGALLCDVLATVLAMPVALFPVVNAERFGGRPEVLGLFLTAVAAGGIAAGLLSGYVTRSQRPGVVMLGSAAVWGIALGGFGLAAHAAVAFGCLAIAGAADTFSVISRGTVLQIATLDSHRGRVSAAEHIVGVAGPDLGNLRAGVVGDLTSATAALVSGGLACAAGVTLLAARNRPLRTFDRQAATCAR